MKALKKEDEGLRVIPSNLEYAGKVISKVMSKKLRLLVAGVRPGWSLKLIVL